MAPGQQVAPGMPENSTVDTGEMGQAPDEGMPDGMQSPITMGTQGGGANLLYLARRAATALGQVDEAQKQQMLTNMKLSNPQLYSVVIRIILKEQGSQTDPLSATQSPLPQQKPERRASHVGA